MNILIIDDIRELRDVLREQLEDEGFHVFEAGNGKDGLEILSTTDIDLVISDIDMPVMTGIQFLMHVKNLKKTVPPVYIMTGAGRFTKEMCIDMGASGYFNKGDELNQMVEFIKNIKSP